MKVTKITAATENKGTVFYKVTYKDLSDVFDNSNQNLWIRYVINALGIQAIKVDTLWGSKIVDDALYICETNGEEIEVEDKMVNPEDALEDYPIESLQDYIIDSPDRSIIEAKITDYEIDFGDIQSVAIEMLNNGELLQKIVDDGRDVDIIE